MIFLDTGYLVALLDPLDEHDRRAQAWAAQIRERLLTTEYVIWETVNYFSPPSDRPKVHALVDTISKDSDYTIVSSSPALLEAGMRLHRERLDKHWSLTDCIPFRVMELHRISQALAIDRHFEQAGFDALLRRDPP